MPEEYVIGFDIGGTRLKSGGVLSSGELIEPNIGRTGFSLGPEAILRALTDEVRRIAVAVGYAPAAIGLGFPGAVDPGFGVVLLPGKLHLEGFPIVPRLQEALQVPVVADNDGRLSMMAEARYGRAREHEWAVTITLGTGVGSGVLLDGKVLRDPHLMFGTQASHVVQEASSDRQCITRGRGTSNILCSATALAMMARDGLQRGLPSILNDLYFADPHSVDFKAVIRGVERGDALCMDVLDRWTTHLGWFLVSVVHMYAPEIIILGGGAANEAHHFLDRVQQHVDGHVFRHPKGESVPIVCSELRDHVGVLGSAALAWEHVRKGRGG